MKRLFTALSAIALVGGTATAFAADNTPANTSGNNVLVQKTQRASKVMGANVRNSQGEKLGTIDDLVIDIEKGDINYAAVGVGGVLGVGEKLFAVPYHEMKLVFDKDEMYFVLNVSKQKLQDSPGFDKNNWPNFADHNFTQKIDDYYNASKTNKSTDSTRR